MAAVSEMVVREFFEVHGFLVSQPRKYVGKQKEVEDEVDLVVINPSVKEQKLPDYLLWSAADLKHVSRAVVGVRGWHTERFYGSTFERTPEILRFLEDQVMRFATRMLGDQPIARVLCLPRLPASGELKDKALNFLKEKGMDGVISFETILVDLMRSVDKSKNYEKSDLLQVIRMLKCYDLLKEEQMNLFDKKKRQ
jgi:hypothetical protein